MSKTKNSVTSPAAAPAAGSDTGTPVDPGKDVHVTPTAPAFDRQGTIAEIMATADGVAEDTEKVLNSLGDSALESILREGREAKQAGREWHIAAAFGGPANNLGGLLGGLTDGLLSRLITSAVGNLQPDVTKYNVDMGCTGLGMLLGAAKPMWGGNPLAGKAIDQLSAVLQDFIRRQLGKSASDPVVLPPQRALAPGEAPPTPRDEAARFVAAQGIAAIPPESYDVMLAAEGEDVEALAGLERGNAIRLLSDPKLLSWFFDNRAALWELVKRFIGS